MLAGCALVALALWPSARLRIGPAPGGGAKLYPRNRFVVRFLIVWAIWNLATGVQSVLHDVLRSLAYARGAHRLDLLGIAIITGIGFTIGSRSASEIGAGDRHGGDAAGHFLRSGGFGHRADRIGCGGVVLLLTRPRNGCRTPASIRC